VASVRVADCARARGLTHPPADKFRADVHGDGSNVPRSQPGAPKRRLRDKISNGGKKSRAERQGFLALLVAGNPSGPIPAAYRSRCSPVVSFSANRDSRDVGSPRDYDPSKSDLGERDARCWTRAPRAFRRNGETRPDARQDATGI